MLQGIKVEAYYGELSTISLLDLIDEPISRPVRSTPTAAERIFALAACSAN
jgi:hypothetical protein